LVVDLGLLVVLSSPGSHPRPAQAQTAAHVAVLNVNGNEIATFSNVAEATSSIKLPRADGKATQLEPIRVVLEKTADGSLELSAWHRQASTQLTGYRKDATLTFYDSSGTPTLRLFLKNAWPAEYQIEQQDTQVVERVTLTAAYFERVAP
jgi:T4-like virus tail tube protein gp19